MMQPSCVSSAQYADFGPYSNQAIPCFCPSKSKWNLPANTTENHVPCGDAMPSGRQTSGMGTLIFKPQEIKLQDPTKQIDAYCQVKLGLHSERTSIVKGQGTKWNEQIALRYKGQEFAEVKIKDKSVFRLKNKIGEGKIQLAEAISQGRANQWVPLSKKGQVIGEIHFLIEFVPESM